MSLYYSKALRHWCGPFCSTLLSSIGRRRDLSSLHHRNHVHRQQRTVMSSSGEVSDLAAGKKAAAFRAVDECVKVHENDLLSVHDQILLVIYHRMGSDLVLEVVPQ